MSVHFKSRRSFRKATPSVVATLSVVAADILKDDHPLNGAFLAWLIAKDNPKATPTKRQAAAYLAEYPQLRGAAKAA